MSQIIPIKVGNFLQVMSGNSRILYQIVSIDNPCSYCGGNDAVKLMICANNDEGQDISTQQYSVIDNKVGYKIKLCVKLLYDDVMRSNPLNLFMYPESFNEDIQKRLLTDISI